MISGVECPNRDCPYWRAHGIEHRCVTMPQKVLREVEAHFSVKIKRIAIDAPSDASRHSSFSSSSLRVVNGIVAFPRQMFASLSPLWLSIKSQRKGSTFLPFMEHALSDISKVRLLFNVGANFGRGV